jgi:hypothetical protein
VAGQRQPQRGGGCLGESGQHLDVEGDQPEA